MPDLRTHIETSGVYPLTGTWDWVCFSPKKFKAPDPSIFSKADELKVIIYNKSDFAWAEEFASKVNRNCQLFLQPEWSKEKEMLPLIIDYVKANPKWQVSLQVHKYMNIPKLIERAMNISEFTNEMNRWGHAKVPFLFMVDFEMEKPLLVELIRCRSKHKFFLM